MEVINIAFGIRSKIELLEKMRKEIKERAENKARSISEYDKALALAIIKIKNKAITEFDGEEIKATAANEIEKIARGYCWKERLEMETADGLYKSVISNINSVMAEINGLQSINKHLD